MAGLARVRPILITSLTTIIALVPLAMGKAEYVTEIGAPFAITIIGGLGLSTLLTLVFILHSIQEFIMHCIGYSSEVAGKVDDHVGLSWRKFSDIHRSRCPCMEIIDFFAADYPDSRHVVFY